MIELSTHKHIHLVGIGGIGVSAIAEILLKKGFVVSGSDMVPSDITKRLENKGVMVHYGHSAENITGADLLVYTAAASDDNPEIAAAREKGIITVSRAEMLGRLMSFYEKSIAVAGVHGKTTTTSMISIILHHAAYDPTLLIGGDLPAIGGNARFGDSGYFVTEACEYKESFLHFHPETALILNIDEDHLDYFKDLEHIINSFTKFSSNVKQKGYIVCNGDDYNVLKVAGHHAKNVNLITFGINKEATYRATQITYNASGFPCFHVSKNGSPLMDVELSIPGVHNIYNALAAIATCDQYQVPVDATVAALKEFTGAKRRFDKVGTYNGAQIIDDYAHHPNEVKATLAAAKKVPHNKTLLLFQPHTYTRTKELLGDFATAFRDADEVIILDIYASREKDPGDIHSKDLVARIIEEGQAATYLSSFDEAIDYLVKTAQPHDIIFTMGAGNVYEIGYRLAEM